MKTWHEDDNFWETMGPVMFTKDHWERAPEEIENIIALLELGPSDHILDLCCGPGRHSLELARKGFQVLGVDRTPKYIKAARRRAEREKLDVAFLQEAMRSFCRPATFDAVINLYTSFGYFKNQEDDMRVLNNVYRSLKEGGKAVIDVVGKEFLVRNFQERERHEEGGIIFLQERKINSSWDWIQNRWILVMGNERKEFTLEHRLYSGAELSSLLLEAGFKSVKLFGDFSGIPHDQTTKRLIALAIK